MFTFLVDPPPCVPVVEDKLLRTPYQTINYQCILRSLSHRQGHVAKLLDFLKQLNLFYLSNSLLHVGIFNSKSSTKFTYKCRHISVQKQIFSYLLLFFSTTFIKKIWQTRHMHAASHIADINTNVCSIIRLLSGNWLICHVNHVDIRKSFMYVIEVDLQT